MCGIRTTTAPCQSRRRLAVRSRSIIRVPLIGSDHSCGDGRDALPRFQDGARRYLSHAGKEDHQNSGSKYHVESRNIGKDDERANPIENRLQTLFFIGARLIPVLISNLFKSYPASADRYQDVFFKEPINGSDAHVAIRLQNALLCLPLDHVPLRVVAVQHVNLPLER